MLWLCNAIVDFNFDSKHVGPKFVMVLNVALIPLLPFSFFDVARHTPLCSIVVFCPDSDLRARLVQCMRLTSARTTGSE